MTRKEEIQNYAYNNCITEDVDDTSYYLIVDAVKWADETMLNHACEWLAEHISPEEIYEGETNETPTTYLTVNIHTTMYDFINDFRKTMKGGSE